MDFPPGPQHRKNPPHRRRTADAPSCGKAHRETGPHPRSRSHPHHQRFGAGREGAGAEGCRAHPRDRQPGFARRRRFPRHERRGLPGRQGTGWHRRSRSCRPHAGKDQHGGEARRQRPQHRRHGTPLPRQRPHRPLHRIHGCGRHQRLVYGRCDSVRRSRAPHSRRHAAGSHRCKLCGRSGRTLALPGWQRRDRRDFFRDASVLQYLYPLAAFHGGLHVYLSLRLAGTRSQKPIARRRQR